MTEDPPEEFPPISEGPGKGSRFGQGFGQAGQDFGRIGQIYRVQKVGDRPALEAGGVETAADAPGPDHHAEARVQRNSQAPGYDEGET